MWKSSEPADDRVERLVVPPGRDVRLGEAHVGRARGRRPCPRLLQHSGGLVDADDGARRTHHRADHQGDVPEAGAQVEHAHPTADAPGAEKDARRTVEERCLRVQAADLVVPRSERVPRRAPRSTFDG
jgi:hypothetical protein